MSPGLVFEVWAPFTQHQTVYGYEAGLQPAWVIGGSQPRASRLTFVRLALPWAGMRCAFGALTRGGRLFREKQIPLRGMTDKKSNYKDKSKSWTVVVRAEVVARSQSRDRGTRHPAPASRAN